MITLTLLLLIIAALVCAVALLAITVGIAIWPVLDIAVAVLVIAGIASIVKMASKPKKDDEKKKKES